MNLMKIKDISVNETLAQAEKQLNEEENLSPGLKKTVTVMMKLIEAFSLQMSKNSKNSHKPPSTDAHHKPKPKKKKKNPKKPGGQPGRVGVQLKPSKTPDEIKHIKIDRRTLPKDNYTTIGFEARQIVDFSISTCITEYRAEILLDSKGKRHIASFPDFVKRPIQYGPKTKATAVYLSQYQLIPYQRIADYFSQQVGFNLSPGSIVNFNREAYEALSTFDKIAKEKLINTPCLNADETGIRVDNKKIWLHTACNDKWTHFATHEKRGAEAMNAIGIMPKFKGIMCHDHWKSYYRYDCQHALCNAHHLRELKWSFEEDSQAWAEKMSMLLNRINKKVIQSEGMLSYRQIQYYKKAYNKILISAEKECPAPKRKKGQKGRLKKSKSRNLLERLLDYREDVLRFMTHKSVPFTNNQSENDLRMTKVQQKISGCFRSKEGASIFCRIRGYLITCRKHDVNASEALELLFQGKLPDFVNSS